MAKKLPALQGMISERKEELAKMLPDHIKAETFERAAYNAIMRTPDLANCDPTSVYDSLMRSAQDGLIPDGRESAIVVYNSKQGKRAQYQPMIDGVLKRVRQSGIVENISAKPVYANDQFDYWMDEQGEHIHYRPTWSGDKGDFILAFAYAKLRGGEMVVEVMTKSEIDKVRKASKTGNSQYGPWSQWYDRMAVKSVYHRLARRLPSNSEVIDMVSAIERDIDAEFEKAKDVTPKRRGSTMAEMLASGDSHTVSSQSSAASDGGSGKEEVDTGASEQDTQPDPSTDEFFNE